MLNKDLPATQPSSIALSHDLEFSLCPIITLKPLSLKLRACAGPCTP